MKKLPKIPIVITLIVLGLALAGTVWARTAQNPAAKLRALGSGGQMAQGDTVVDYTLGEPVVGRDSQSGTDLCAGFWCGVDAVRYATPTPTDTPTNTPTHTPTHTPTNTPTHTPTSTSTSTPTPTSTPAMDAWIYIPLILKP